MEDKFRSHEADFNKLVIMIKADTKLDSVDETAAYLPGDPGAHPKAEISTERMSEYRRLIRQTGVKKVTRNRAGDRITFEAWQGWGPIDPSNTQYKDYVYDENPPSPLVASLDKIDNKVFDSQDRTDEDGKRAFKKIADKWYLNYILID